MEVGSKVMENMGVEYGFGEGYSNSVVHNMASEMGEWGEASRIN